MTTRPITLTIAALGGQGGGVVQEWMIAVARRNGYFVQATSVPGVAQRTGATVYYLEFHPGGRNKPVMALMPVAENCDLVVASELVEAARMIQRGFVSDNLTTLVTSNHRTYTIDEKTHLADGRADRDELLNLVDNAAKELVIFDMEAVASAHGSVISAALLGGIAASGVLPFSIEHYETAIREGGRGVEANLNAFHGAVEAARNPIVAEAEVSPVSDAATSLPEFPPAVSEVVRLALPRLRDYQDKAYGTEYLNRLKPFCEFRGNNYALAVELARGLAVWMTFEDTIRVADLKTQPGRILGILDGSAGDITHITEFMKPRIEELTGTMPAPLGRWIQRSSVARACLVPFTRGLKIRSSGIFGYLVLRAMASMRFMRRWTLRYQEEISNIEAWLDLVMKTALENEALALEVARCQELVTGYGDTRERGLKNFQEISALISKLIEREDGNEVLKALREAALKEDTGSVLTEAMTSHELIEAAG